MFASRSMLRIFSKSQLCTGFRNTKVLFRRRVAGFLAGRRDCAPHRRCAVGKTRANKTAACARSPLCIHSLHTPVAITPCLYVYRTSEEQTGGAYACPSACKLNFPFARVRYEGALHTGGRRYGTVPDLVRYTSFSSEIYTHVTSRRSVNDPPRSRIVRRHCANDHLDVVGCVNSCS